MNQTLAHVFAKVDACTRCKKQRNPLKHILGGGETKNPRFAFVFINPTHRNRSSAPDYDGTRRYPFIGVRHFYRFLADAGFLKPQTVRPLYTRGWQREDEQQERKEREERVVGDGGRVGEIVAIDQLDEPAPRGNARKSENGTQAPQDPLRRHACDYHSGIRGP